MYNILYFEFFLVKLLDFFFLFQILIHKTYACVQLLESFEQSFPELNFPPLPERGDLDLKNVLESTYFFNWSR